MAPCPSNPGRWRPGRSTLCWPEQSVARAPSTVASYRENVRLHIKLPARMWCPRGTDPIPPYCSICSSAEIDL